MTIPCTPCTRALQQWDHYHRFETWKRSSAVGIGTPFAVDSNVQPPIPPRRTVPSVLVRLWLLVCICKGSLSSFLSSWKAYLLFSDFAVGYRLSKLTRPSQQSCDLVNHASTARVPDEVRRRSRTAELQSFVVWLLPPRTTFAYYHFQQ